MPTVIEIAAKVAYFEPPYEYLKNVRAGFDSTIRFMLDKCLAGDRLACRARDGFVFQQKNWFRPARMLSTEDAWREFFTLHNDEYLAYIRVPMLIVQGEDDEYGTRAQIAVAQQESFCPVEICLLPGAGHSPHVDRPEETLAAIGEFVARVLALHEGLAPAA